MYYCNGFSFEDYYEAARYADILLYQFGIYKAIFTRAEITAQLQEVL